MLASGFEVRELRDSGVSILELIRAGVEPTDFRKAKIGIGELMEGMEGCRMTSLRELADCYGIDAIRKECGMSDLRELYRLHELLEVFSAEEISGGNDVGSLLKAGFSTYDIWKAGYSQNGEEQCLLFLGQKLQQAFS